MALARLIVATWLTGDKATAEAYVAQVLQHIQPIDHVFSLGIALVKRVFSTRSKWRMRRERLPWRGEPRAAWNN